MIDDEKIIELFFERSEQAIRELDIKYGKICHNLSYNIVNSRQDAEECVNDAYLGAWNAIPPVRPNPLLSYIVKIVRNISLKIYWRKEAAKRSGHYTIALEEIEGCIADQKTVEDEIEARELARIIEAFLDTLTVKERVIRTRWHGKETERSIFLSCPSKCWNSSLSVTPISRIAAHLKSSVIRFVSTMKRWRKQSPLCLLTAEILSCCPTSSICPTLKLQMC